MTGQQCTKRVVGLPAPRRKIRAGTKDSFGVGKFVCRFVRGGQALLQGVVIRPQLQRGRVMLDCSCLVPGGEIQVSKAPLCASKSEITIEWKRTLVGTPRPQFPCRIVC